MKALLADETSGAVLLNQDRVLQQVTSDCPACAQVNPGKAHLQRGARQRGHRPGIHWETDFTEVKPGLYGYRYLLVFVDTFSGWIEAFPTKKETANMVVKKMLEEIFPSKKVIAPISINCQKMGKIYGENMYYIHFNVFTVSSAITRLILCKTHTSCQSYCEFMFYMHIFSVVPVKCCYLKAKTSSTMLKRFLCNYHSYTSQCIEILVKRYSVPDSISK
ncbi:hypothetical protein STEG23_001507, partial [Scotinomys teguina]